MTRVFVLTDRIVVTARSALLCTFLHRAKLGYRSQMLNLVLDEGIEYLRDLEDPGRITDETRKVKAVK